MDRKTLISVLLLVSLAACVNSSEKYLEQTSAAETAIYLQRTDTPQPTITPVSYNLIIEVVDENGLTLPNVKIIMGETFLTNEQGKWSSSFDNQEFSAKIWGQGYMPQTITTTLSPGSNEILVALEPDPYGINKLALVKEGYILVFVEDFQDNILDCVPDGNGNIFPDDSADDGNLLLLVDLRNLETSFSCEFGPTNIQNAFIEVDFRYPEIQYSDFKTDEYYHWQGYGIGFRDGFAVDGYPIKVPWGATIQIGDYRADEWQFPVATRQNIEENIWYTLTTEWNNSVIEARINGSRKFRYLKAPEIPNTEPSEIYAFNQAYIQFDNIKMWVPVE